MKNAAMEYIEETQKGAVNTQMAAELEMLRAKNPDDGRGYGIAEDESCGADQAGSGTINSTAWI